MSNCDKFWTSYINTREVCPVASSVVWGPSTHNLALDAGIQRAALSQDGALAATIEGANDRRLRVYNAADGALIAEPAAGLRIAEMAFSADGAHLVMFSVTVLDGGVVQSHHITAVLDVDSMSVVYGPDPGYALSSSAYGFCAVRPDGLVMGAVSNSAGTGIDVYELDDFSGAVTAKGSYGFRPRHGFFCADGTKLGCAIAETPGFAAISVQNQQQEAGTPQFDRLDWAAAGDTFVVAVAAFDHVAKVYDVFSWAEVADFADSFLYPFTCAVSQVSNHALVGGWVEEDGDYPQKTAVYDTTTWQIVDSWGASGSRAANRTYGFAAATQARILLSSGAAGLGSIYDGT